MLGQVVVAFAGAFGLVAAALAVTTLPASSAKATHVVGFGVTGAPQQFVVPAGVTTLDVTLAGGAGGDGSDAEAAQAARTPGGKGAVLTSVLKVTPGQVLYVHTGDKGTPTDFDLPEGTTSCVGAFGGGGAGGFQLGGHHGRPMCGPGGGGASDVRTSPDPASRLLVAGGGGGSAQGFAQWPAACGPVGGGASGAQGAPTTACEPTVVGGRPGTLTAGGAGTVPYYAANPDRPDLWPAGATCGEPPSLGPVIPGGDGTFGQGGAAGRQDLSGSGENYVPVGGAGGGGWYGGGGGASMWFDGQLCQGLSGGGGGSSYVAPAKNWINQLLFDVAVKLGLFAGPIVDEGANTGQGWVTITWTTE